MPRVGISVQHTACTRRAARRRVLARSFCAHFPLRASLAPSAPALASHGVLLTLQVESCTSPWLCTLLRLFLLSLSISAVRHTHTGRPSPHSVMQHHTARPRATEAGRRAAARMANPSKNRKKGARLLQVVSVPSLSKCPITVVVDAKRSDRTPSHMFTHAQIAPIRFVGERREGRDGESPRNGCMTRGPTENVTPNSTRQIKRGRPSS